MKLKELVNLNWRQLSHLACYVLTDSGSAEMVDWNYPNSRPLMADGNKRKNRSAFACFYVSGRDWNPWRVFAVHSYLDVPLSDEEIIGIATDFAKEKFNDHSDPVILRG